MRFPEKDITTIAIFRALQLGDLLCSIPAFRALRNAYPAAQVTVIGMPWMKMLPQRFPEYFNAFTWFPGFPGLPEQAFDPKDVFAFLTEMNGKKFDLALQMQGNGSIVNPMIQLFGAKHTAGFFRKEDYFPGHGFLEYPTGISEIHRHLLLMTHLGIPSQGDHLEFPIKEKDREDLQQASLGLADTGYICVHPGSRGEWRQWPPECFALIANACSRMGYRIVLTGTADELPIIHRVAANLEKQPVIAAGKTSMGAMAALLRDSAGLVSNCTGVSHIAAALSVKSIVISMDGEPERWAPLNTSLHKTFDWTKTQDPGAVMWTAQHLFATSGQH